MHSLRLRPARDEDVPAMAALEVAAFLDSPMHKAMFPKRLRIKPGVQDQLEWNVARMRRGLADPNLHYLVVLTDAPGRGEIIIGCAEWSAPAPAHDRHGDDGEEDEEEKARDLELRMARLPPFLDKSALLDANDEVMELIAKSKDAFRGQNRHRMWTLNSISVDGDYRGIGVGKMLTRWGMERADRDRTGIWIISSPLGLQLYKSLGFTQVAEGSRLGEPQYLMLKFYEPGPGERDEKESEIGNGNGNRF
ncbi:acyl-CoA N-acyltransferase [Trichoderma citrinoviride]|uniref:Acyl-CoA N-acyltransferase n=1 Tax=Trichoderma citrinoviride TaxID=58853 RepID=A0A2T4BFP2_9HYPO|nr:acyl-CoA N-acyltransferase [Trichoderma citrinoviride]PTB68163.1 acyl-CoA N-acyltransferase [Trichoderma citrinoviride]